MPNRSIRDGMQGARFWQAPVSPPVATTPQSPAVFQPRPQPVPPPAPVLSGNPTPAVTPFRGGTGATTPVSGLARPVTTSPVMTQPVPRAPMPQPAATGPGTQSPGAPVMPGGVPTMFRR